MPEWVITARVTPERPDDLTHTIDNRDGTVTLYWQGAAPTPGAAVNACTRHVRDVAGGAVWHGVTVSTPDEYDRRVEDNTIGGIPPLVGVKDIASRLGVSHQMASRLAKRTDLFPNRRETSAGTVFLASDLERVARLDRRPGRPWPRVAP